MQVDKHFDLFVIGAGSGGVRLARMAAQHGVNVGIAESRYLGGTCVNVGCVPKKLFVYASHVAEDLADGFGFGWNAQQSPQFDWNVLRDNKTKEIQRLNAIYGKLLDDAGVTLYQGHAGFVSNDAIQINGEIITADRFVLATGSWPFVPEFEGSEHVITSNELFFLESLPKTAIVVGGGYIAVEMAGILSGLGVDTTLMYRGEMFLKQFDHDVRTFVRDEIEKHGIRLVFNTNVVSIEKDEDDKLRVLDTAGETQLVDSVLYATGRRALSDGLGLQHTDVEVRDDGVVVVDDSFKTSAPNIYALGDLIGRYQLTPVAIAEAMWLKKTWYEGYASPMDYDSIATAVFCQPNIGTVGLTEEEAIEQRYEIDIFRSSFKPMKHTLSGRDERNMMKLVVDRETDRVLGVHMVGDHAGEIIQGLAVALKMGMKKSDLDQTIGIHPTAAEEFVTMREPVSSSI